MKCQKCKKNDASVHMAYITNTGRKDYYLCKSCSQEQENPSHLNSESVWENDFWKSMLGGYKYEDEMNACPACGMTYQQFNGGGRFGCTNCYKHFSRQVQLLLERLQGRTKHVGKVPLHGVGVFSTSRQIQKLKQKLQIALQNERYEEAASIRDEIKALEK